MDELAFNHSQWDSWTGIDLLFPLSRGRVNSDAVFNQRNTTLRETRNTLRESLIGLTIVVSHSL